MGLDQIELVVQPLFDFTGHRAVTPHSRLITEPPQVGQRRISVRHVRVWERGAQVELALLRDAQRVGNRLRELVEQRLHLGMRLQVQVVVGPQMRERLVDGRVEPRRDQRVLEPRALGAVVVDVVGGHDRRSGLARQRDQLTVALSVPVQEVSVELDVHRVGAVPLHVAPQKRAGFGGATAR